MSGFGDNDDGPADVSGFNWNSPFDGAAAYTASPNLGTEWEIPFRAEAYMPAYLTYSAELQRIAVGLSTMAPARGDQRFRDDAWSANPVHRTQLQSYLAYCRFAQDWLDGSKLEGMEKSRAQFRLDTLLAALSPSNSLYMNPTALSRYRETGGASYVEGMKNYARDLRENQGRPRQFDPSKFELGENLATLPGQVVFRNEMVELIQYAATTDRVHAVPMLVCSSVVNKYYLCDLTPEGSLYRFLVDEGYQVFVAVWRNPTEAQAHWGVAEYVGALLQVINVVTDIADNQQPHLTGFCAGAYITLSTLAYQAATNKRTVATHSIILNAVDTVPEESPFSAMSSDQELAASKQRVIERGICTADELTLSFNVLQPDKLYWPYFVQNYLLGEDPDDTAVMFWMNDQVNLPARMFCQFIDISRDRALVRGEITVGDIRVDLGAIDCETFMLGALKDHVVPWSAVYRTREHLHGPTRFVLTTGGHVTGMVTAADDPREACLTNDDTTNDPEAWLAGTTEQPHSWRYEWVAFLHTAAGDMVEAPVACGNIAYPALTAAPGLFVLETV